MFNAPSTQKAIIQGAGGTLTIATDVLVPRLRPGIALVQICAVALNPTDWKLPTHFPAPGTTVGCDFAGTVLATSTSSAETPSSANAQLRSHLKVGDRVCGALYGSDPLNPENGAFAEYVLADVDMLLRVPEAVGWAEAAAIGGIGHGTVNLAMWQVLKLPGWPTCLENDNAPPGQTSENVLVYGGNTATEEIAGKCAESDNTDFFHVGGNSTLLIQLQALMQRTFSVKVPLIKLFEFSTLGAMASLLDEERGSIAAEAMDWNRETQPDATLSSLDEERVAKSPAQSPTAQRIHCVAVRSNHSSSSISTCEKVMTYEGDLSLPRLGLDPLLASQIFAEADAVIHCGAEVSHMKSYGSLRPANFQSTKELVALALPRKVPVHYISSAGVAMLSGRAVLYEESLAAWPPSGEGGHGYNAAKWASERYLERVSDAYGLQVCIHRPTSILREDGLSGSEEGDILQSMMKYSRLARAVPMVPNVSGDLNFVPAQEVARDVVRGLGLKGGEVLTERDEKIRYVNNAGSLVIKYDQMAKYLKKETGETVEEVHVEEWLERAKLLGLNETVAGFFKHGDFEKGFSFPEVVKGPGSG